MPIRFNTSSRAAALAFAAMALPARADCIDAAAARHHVNAVVLRAIGWQESGLQPGALGHNANGSVDVGAFQINSTHLAELARHGIDRASLSDGCVSAEVAAWHYRRQVDQQGDTWQAVGAYHSHTAARAAWYANRIATILMRWKLMPAGALPFPAELTLAPDAPAHPRRPLQTAPTRPTAPIAPNAPTEPTAPTGPTAPSAPAPVASVPGGVPAQGYDVLAFTPSVP